MERLPDVWVISDTHFSHKKIGEYCNRPKNWQTLIFNNWNNIVKENDIVLHLGDFSFGGFEKVKNVRRMLNGEIYLIRGNHDRHSIKWYNRAGIECVSPFKARINKKSYYFSHKPHKGSKLVNIHGHQHDTVPKFYRNGNNLVNVHLSVEVIDYRPVKLKDVLHEHSWMI